MKTSRPSLYHGMLSVVGLVGTLLSLLWWRAEANLCFCEYCPDGYCDYSAKLFAVITRWDPESLRALGEFANLYIHAHSSLGPILQAVLSLVVPHPLVSYMVLSALATVASWLLLRSIVRTAYAPPSPVALLLGAAFFTHFLVVRAFARPLTDAVGMVCVIASLWALEHYRRHRTPGHSIVLIAVQLLGLFSRVSFIPMLGMPALMELLEPGRLPERLRRAILSGLLHGVLPGLLFLSANALLGTLHLTEAWAWAHDPMFTQSYSLSHFFGSVTAAGQGYAILILASASRASLAHPTFRLHLAWVGLYLAFLALGGGALWPRYFLPIVPSLFVLATPVLTEIRASRPWNLYALLLVFSLGNVLFVHPISYDLRLPGRLLLNDVRGIVVPQEAAGTVKHLAPREMHVTASHTPDLAGRMADGNLDTGWPSGTPQSPGMYVQVDLGQTRYPTRVVFGGAVDEYPRRYAIDTSLDGTSWIRLAEGKGIHALGGFLDWLPRVFIQLPSLPARYLRITLTKASKAHWSIKEIDVEVRATKHPSSPVAGPRDHRGTRGNHPGGEPAWVRRNVSDRAAYRRTTQGHTAGPSDRFVATYPEEDGPGGRRRDGVAEVLADMLSADGHHVETAANGAMGLDKYPARPVTAKLTSLRLVATRPGWVTYYGEQKCFSP